MGLTTPCNEYNKFSTAWRKTRDVVEGVLTVKGAKETYLPKGRMSPTDYADYLERAEFVGYVDKIIDYSAGQLLRNPPVLKGVPDDIVADFDLCGNSITSIIDHISRELMTVERVGIWFDYSEDQKRPYAVIVKAENIIKWNYGYVNGTKTLKSIVLALEEEKLNPVTFDTERNPTWVCLYINEDGYFQKDTYVNKSGKAGEVELSESVVPVAGIGGKPLDFIPFAIVPAKGTPEHIHTAAMYPVAEVNLSLYRSMASREQLLFYYGMPTGIAIGWDQETFPIGGVAKFPTGGDFKFAQIEVDDAVVRAIQDKKEEISQLGSSFLSGRGRYVASAQTSENNQQGDYASLSSIANAISRALTDILRDMAVYGHDGLEKDASVTVNTEFEEPEFTPGELTELGAEVAAGRLSWDAYFHNCQKNKLYPNGWTKEQEFEAIKTTSQMIASARTQIPGFTF